MTTFKIEVKGDAIAKLARLQRRISDTAPLMAGAAVALRKLTEEAFEREGVVGGESWKPLALSTIRQREKKGTWPGKKLQSKEWGAGGMLSSLSATHTATAATVSVGKKYSAIHQFGGMAGRGRKVEIPVRTFLPIKGDARNAELTPRANSVLSEVMQAFVEAAGS
ncbi:MAG: phage virion morphogenesis protein [Candidatus Accumulibacter sp.]|nr:phage virion morphogenesis protein [Accumulibacter sp.]